MRRFLAALVLALLTTTFVVASPASAETFTVDAVNFEFVPGEIQIQPGDTITWVNRDPGPHTATASDGSWSHALEAAGSPNDTASQTFPNEGVFPYFCKIHGSPDGSGMAGVVIVGDPPAPPRATLSAGDNVGAALEWSQHVFGDDSSNFALLGRSDLFADSLASGGVQGRLGAPLLLTAGNSLDSRVSSELDRLGVHTVYVFGGEAAINRSVTDALVAAGYTVRRIAGSGRLETANAAADRFFPAANSAVIARGFGDAQDPTRAFADSLGAGAYAAATQQPVLLSETGGLSDATRAYLESHPIESVLLVGGEAALSAQVASDIEALGIAVDRAAGGDRAGTAAQLADRFGGEHEGPSGFTVVDGLNPNAWAAGFPAAAQKWPVVLSMGDTLTPDTIGTVIGSMGGLICAPFTPASVCDRIEIVVDTFFEIPPIVAALSAEEAGTTAEGAAAFSLYPTGDANTLCYDMFGSALADATAAHIHQHSDGTAVVPLDLTPGPHGDPINCAFDLNATLVADIVANPASYYVNVHTAEHPAGSHQGTLFEPRAFLLAEATGEFETAEGDPDGFAFAFFVLDDDSNRVCTAMGVFGLSADPTGAHIHQAPPGEDGPIVLALDTPANNTFTDVVCYDVDQALLDELADNTAAYYFNVHTGDYPDGAVRGQLFNLTDIFAGG